MGTGASGLFDIYRVNFREMKQALILCGGEARRLRPYSYYLPKPCMPFLNLPLLSLAWLYLEHLAISRFLLNAHLFPESLKNTVDFLSSAGQKTEIFPEEQPLGGAGTLDKLKSHLQKTEYFFYINGDSLFFPSDMEQFWAFEKDFLESGAEGAFFAGPLKDSDSPAGALWAGPNGRLQFVGIREALPQTPNASALFPHYFSGLAVFKSSVLDSLKETDFHLFEDFINPLLLSGKSFQVFSDKGARVLEAGENPAYRESMDFCMKALFGKAEAGLGGGQKDKTEESQRDENGGNTSKCGKGEVGEILEKCFVRFDPNDQTVGLKNGQKWSRKLGHPLLAPESVRGLEFLELSGPTVLGSEVSLFGPSLLGGVALGPRTAWKGKLENDIVLKPAFYAN